MVLARRGDIDFLKGMLMFFVVWGHLCAYFINNIGYSGQLLTCYTTLFQMPLFLFVSGFFQKEANTFDMFINRSKKSVMRCGFPYVSYCIMALAFIMVYRVLSKNVYLDFHDIRGVSSAFWYFVTLFAFLIFNNLASMGGGKKWMIIVLIQIILMLIPSHLYYMSFLWIFFVFGNVYQKHENSVDFFYGKLSGKIVLSLMMIIFIAGGWMFPNDMTFYQLQNTFYENWRIILYRYLLYFAASTCVLYLIKYIYKFFDNCLFVKLFRWIGTHTLTIFAGHILILCYIVKPLKLIVVEGNVFSYYVIMPMVTLLIMALLAKVEDYITGNKYLRKVLLGL